MDTPDYRATPEFAHRMDIQDPLSEYRSRFHIPRDASGGAQIYLCGNSLGLQPRSVRAYVAQELDDWEQFGVEGHFHARNPWMPYHRVLTDASARLVGALPHEVVTMNSLTVNLHLLMVSFFRPLPHRHKILIEANAFPSDQYAVQSQLHFHRLDAADSLLTLPLRPGETVHRTDDILRFLAAHGQEIALLLLGGVNYYTGQAFDIAAITQAARDQGCVVGWDLAHAAGNLPLRLHEWGVDFAAWCSYKYLNSGPGGLSGIFIHDRHAEAIDLPRFAGWWGHDQETRFQMGSQYRPMRGAEGWQLSNPPILPLAALRASLEIFDAAGMEALRGKSRLLTGYMAFLMDSLGEARVRIITPGNPDERGCQLSLVVSEKGRQVYDALSAAGVVCDWREPDVIRVAPVPLYNTFEEIYRFYEILRALV